MQNNKVEAMTCLPNNNLLTSIVAAFEDFFANFKSTSTSDATEALEDLHIDGDGTSDEYDFMDDAQDGDGTAARNGRARHNRDPKRKYMDLFGDIANRRRNHVTVELDDLHEVNSTKSIAKHI